MVGTFGTVLVFEVSDNRMLTFSGMTREVSSRWTDHEVMGVKPKPEFLGPGNQTVSLTITLSSSLGVRPRQMLERVANMVERGQVEYLIIDCKPVSKNPLRITGSSEAWNTLYNGGELPGQPDPHTGGVHMTNGLLFDFQLEFTFSDNWLADLDRQIVLLLSTIEGTMPLERGLGIMQDFVDKPPAVVKSLYTAEAARKISEFIPQVRVQEVIWLPAEQGHFKPKVVITRA